MKFQKPYLPWYDDKRDYNTNAPTYYDYLANSIELERTQTEAINNLLVRDVNFQDSDEVHVDKLTNWHADDQNHTGEIRFKAHVITSPSSTTQTIDGTDYVAPNAVQVLHDGLYAPDYKKVLDKYSTDNNAKFTKLTNDVKSLDVKTQTNINKVDSKLPQKEQLLQSTRGTLSINHGSNNTTEKTNVDTNPQKVLEHDNLTVGNGLTKTHASNSQTTELKLSDDFISNNTTNVTGDGNVTVTSTNTKYGKAHQVGLSNAFIEKVQSVTTSGSFRNLVLRSNDFENPSKVFAGAPNGTTVVGHAGDYFTLKTTGATSSPWGGIGWQLTLTEIAQGEEFSVFVPVFIDGSVAVDGTIRVEIKDSSNNFIWNYDLPTTTKNQWVTVKATFTASKSITIGHNNAFTVSLSKNGAIRVKPPMLVRGHLIPCDYQIAVEDIQSSIQEFYTHNNIMNPEIYSWHVFSVIGNVSSGNWGIEFYNDKNAKLYNIRIKPAHLISATEGSTVAQQSITALENAGVPHDVIEKAKKGYIFRSGYYVGDSLRRVAFKLFTDGNVVTIKLHQLESGGTLTNTDIVKGLEASPAVISYRENSLEDSYLVEDDTSDTGLVSDIVTE